jgi:hypothetical protein
MAIWSVRAVGRGRLAEAGRERSVVRSFEAVRES